MERYTIRKIDNLTQVNLRTLIEESQKEGFRFLKRLVHEYENGSNIFDKPGEALYGVFDERGRIIAIGGINKDPYSTEDDIGRLRRFYVAKELRRNGIGRMLVQRIMYHSSIFKVIVLKTDTEQADTFYKSLGFRKKTLYSKSTHYLELG
ncbi:GNAT family N-acetyltransferase [Paucisalibacillus sp. EB02]|uniref:GNAT family N-acetyltransferase n=1 Tax=Paucisalibacillus sp. EB02 TaxID=1347087 RepID=UPI0005A93B5D|nr:GNAT family N-acetyltransferase [Paucisalibacillus sp. EB02]